MRGRKCSSIFALLPLVALSGDSRGQSSSASQEQRAQITLATVSANYREGLLRLAQEYKQLHPEIEVRIQVQPPNEYETWLRTQIGLLVDLTAALEQTNPYTGKSWKQNLDVQFLEKYKIAGDVAVIPLDFIRPLARVGYKNVPDSKTAVPRTKFSCLESAKHGTAERDLHEKFILLYSCKRSIEIAFFYNRDIFDQLGLKPPRTWEEMLAHAERIRRAGYVPFAVPGDAVPLVMSQPGDWDYPPRVNGGFRLNVNSPYNDAPLIMNQERLIAAVRDGQIRMESERFREAYTKIAEFATYLQRGFNRPLARVQRNEFLVQVSFRRAVLRTLKAREFRP